MNTWSYTESGFIHCGRSPYWDEHDCGDPSCYTLVCSKCQEELPDCVDVAV